MLLYNNLEACNILGQYFNSLYNMNYANVSILTKFHVCVSSSEILNKDNVTNSKHRMYMLQNLFFILIKIVYRHTGFFS